MTGREKTTGRIRGTLPEIEAAARRMRERWTPAEHVLWEAIRERRLSGLRFRCQHPVGAFILDFYCPAIRLAVEVDGDVHDLQVQQDLARTEMLQRYGYHLIRIHNDEVLSDLPSILERITAAAQQGRVVAPDPPYP